jgi:hypothetical protein
MSDDVRKSAALSECRRYRYVLERVWDEAAPAFVVIGLNPSTADETEDDPTIRRCMGFARRFRCGRLCMLNLFAWRSTDPKGLRDAVDPIGPLNDTFLRGVWHLPAATIVAAWGAAPFARGRDREVRKLFGDRLEHLGLTKDGHPKHPLYLKADTPLTRWTP